MTPEQRRVFDKLSLLFPQALERPEDERDAFIERVSQEDPAVGQALADLLAAHETGRSEEEILDELASQLHADPEATFRLPSTELQKKELDRLHEALAKTERVPKVIGDSDPFAGKQIGPYKLLERIGEGGFGLVYRAERSKPRQKVAIKLLKSSKADQERVVTRFKAEQQALALMNHPNIAKLHDAAVDEEFGAYFVMEYVGGKPITDHCDEERLGIRERVELLAAVCEAIQHSNEKGVLHRDIKPSNILVQFSKEGAVPKVIDFGVAKALNQPLTEESLHTGINEIIGTLPYMSPEQAGGGGIQEIDARSDVYSLGAVLYELLTGARPYEHNELRQVGYQAIAEFMRRNPPKKPSTKISSISTTDPEMAAEINRDRRTDDTSALSKTVRDDLDWITLKCLDASREQRYSGAGDLARDLRRYLNNEPVEAGPPTVGYRVSKFVQRNRGQVVAGSLVTVAIMAGLVSTGWALAQLKEKDRRLAAADKRRNQQEARDLVEEAKVTEYFDIVAAEEMLREAMTLDPAYMDADVHLAYLLTRTDRRPAAVDSARASLKKKRDDRLLLLLSELEPGGAEVTQANEVRFSQRNDFPYWKAMTLTQSEAEDAFDLLSKYLGKTERTKELTFDALWSRAVYAHHLKQFQDMRADTDYLVMIRPELDLCWELRGAAYAQTGDPETSLKSSDRAIAINGGNWRPHFNRWKALSTLGREDASKALKSCLKLRKEPKDKSAIFFLAAGDEHLRNLDCTAKARQAVALDPENMVALRTLITCLMYKEQYNEALEVCNKALSLEPKNTDLLRDRGTILTERGTPVTDQDAQQAMADFDFAIENTTDPVSRAFAINCRGWLLHKRQKHDEAFAVLKRSETEYRPLVKDQYRFASEYRNLGHAALAVNEIQDALHAYEEALRLDSTDLQASIGLGLAQWFSGDKNQAIETLQAHAKKPDYEMMYLWIWCIQNEMDDQRAGRSLKAALGTTNENYLKIARFFQSDKTAMAEDEVPKTSQRNDQCEIYCYLGLKAQALNDVDEAARRFKQAQETKATPMIEYLIASRFLRR